jgi:hypothetical protein
MHSWTRIGKRGVRQSETRLRICICTHRGVERRAAVSLPQCSYIRYYLESYWWRSCHIYWVIFSFTELDVSFMLYVSTARFLWWAYMYNSDPFARLLLLASNWSCVVLHKGTDVKIQASYTFLRRKIGRNTHRWWILSEMSNKERPFYEKRKYYHQNNLTSSIYTHFVIGLCYLLSM